MPVLRPRSQAAIVETPTRRLCRFAPLRRSRVEVLPRTLLEDLGRNLVIAHDAGEPGYTHRLE